MTAIAFLVLNYITAVVHICNILFGLSKDKIQKPVAHAPRSPQV
jgi:hypothetical protein